MLGDTTVPGLGVSSNNIIPLITNLQASLKANVPRDPEPSLEPSNSASFQENVGNNNQATDRLSSQVSNNTSNVSTVPNQIGASVQTLVPSSLIEVFNKWCLCPDKMHKISFLKGKQCWWTRRVQKRIKNSMENSSSKKTSTETSYSGSNSGGIC